MESNCEKGFPLIIECKNTSSFDENSSLYRRLSRRALQVDFKINARSRQKSNNANMFLIELRSSPSHNLLHANSKLKSNYHNILNCLNNKERRECLSAWRVRWDRLFLFQAFLRVFFSFLVSLFLPPTQRENSFKQKTLEFQIGNSSELLVGCVSK